MAGEAAWDRWAAFVTGAGQSDGAITVTFNLETTTTPPTSSTTPAPTTSTPVTTSTTLLPTGVQAIACSTLLTYRANLVTLSQAAPAAVRGPVLAQIAQVDRQLAAYGCPIPAPG